MSVLESKKVVLYLMSQKGFEVLHAIIQNSYSNMIAAVIGSKDANVQNDYFDEIKKLANDNTIDFFDKNALPLLENQYSIAISWRWIIKNTNGLIVLHDSLLPKYRGFSPLVNALINFEPKVGVTALFASEEYDTGKVIAQEDVEIFYPIKIEEAITIVSKLYQNIVLEVLTSIENNSLGEGKSQIEEDATYSLWRDEEDYRIDWNKNAEEVRQFIFSVSYPFKGAVSKLSSNENIRIIDVLIIPDIVIENRTPGKLIFIKAGFPVIVCGKGLLKITEAYYENGESALPLPSFRTRLI